MYRRENLQQFYIQFFIFQQTQVIAAAAAGVAAEGLSPKDAKAEAENAAQLSVALVENAIVILMLVEDHLRLQSKLSWASRTKDGSASLPSLISSSTNRSIPLSTIGRESLEVMGDRRLSSTDTGGLPLDVCVPLFLLQNLCIFMDDPYSDVT